MNRATVEELETRHEAKRPKSYWDERGYRTIAIGFNMDDPTARATWAKVLPGVSFDAAYKGQIILTDEQIKALLDYEIDVAEADARDLFPQFDAHPEPVQDALVDMALNMGKPTFSAFNTFRKLIESEHYAEAKADLVNTKWYHQTGQRAKDDLALLDQAANYRSFTPEVRSVTPQGSSTNQSHT